VTVSLRRARRYRGAVLLLLLAFAAGLFAAAVPGVIEKSQSSSLRQALTAASPLDRTVLAEPQQNAGTPWLGGQNPDTSNLLQTLQSLAAGVPASVGPQASLGWSGVRLSEPLPETAQGTSAYEDLDYRSDETSHMRVLSGTMPDAATRSADGTLIFDVAVTQATADRYQARIGSVIARQGYGFRITAIVAPTDPASAFWNYDPTVAAPTFIDSQAKGDYWATAGFVGAGELSALESIQSVQGSPESVATVFCVPLDVRGYGVANSGAILSTLTSFDSGQVATNLGLQVSAGPIAVLNPFAEQRATVDSILSLVMAGAAAVGAVTILLCARLVVGRRRAHFALQRARGQSLPQLAGQVSAGLAAPTLLALAAAWVLARALDADAAWSSQATLLFGGVALVSLFGPPIIAVLDQRGAPAMRTGREDVVRRHHQQPVERAARGDGRVRLPARDPGGRLLRRLRDPALADHDRGRAQQKADAARHARPHPAAGPRGRAGRDDAAGRGHGARRAAGRRRAARGVRQLAEPVRVHRAGRRVAAGLRRAHPAADRRPRGGAHRARRPAAGRLGPPRRPRATEDGRGVRVTGGRLVEH